MGNPSDGFNGKTISMSIANFWAEVTIQESQQLVSLFYSSFCMTMKNLIMARTMPCCDYPTTVLCLFILIRNLLYQLKHLWSNLMEFPSSTPGSVA